MDPSSSIEQAPALNRFHFQRLRRDVEEVEISAEEVKDTNEKAEDVAVEEAEDKKPTPAEAKEDAAAVPEAVKSSSDQEADTASGPDATLKAEAEASDTKEEAKEAAPAEVDFEAVQSGSQAGAVDYAEYPASQSGSETAAEAVAQADHPEYYDTAEADGVKLNKPSNKVSL